jgi:hypothetical protein
MSNNGKNGGNVKILRMSDHCPDKETLIKWNLNEGEWLNIEKNKFHEKNKDSKNYVNDWKKKEKSIKD